MSSSYMNIYVSFFHFFRHDSLQKHGQIAPLDMTIFRASVGQSETALLQAFIPKGQAVPIPVEKLDHGSTTVDEDKKGTGQRVCPQVGTDNAAQSVEGFAHITDASIQIDAMGCAQAEHRERPLSVSTTARKVKASKPRSTSTESLVPRRMRTPEAAGLSRSGINSRKPAAQQGCCSWSLRRHL